MIALNDSIFQRRIRMQNNLLMSRLNHVQNYVTSIFVNTFAITKPPSTFLSSTFDNTLRFMDPTVSTSMSWQVLEIIRLYFLIKTCC